VLAQLHDVDNALGGLIVNRNAQIGKGRSQDAIKGVQRPVLSFDERQQSFVIGTI
jgi:hypothetical protein